MRFIIEDAVPFRGDGCLIWPYSKTFEGYGKAYYKRQHKGAHRVVCEIVNGDCPEGHQAAHSCGNASCVNPNHIRWATPKENTLDKVSHGTYGRRDKHPNAKLTSHKVAVIRATRGIRTAADLAAEYGVSKSTVAMVRAGYNWR